MEALPLPPPPPPSVEIHCLNSVVDNATIDSLPLPPPPEELLQDFGFHPLRLARRAGSSEILSGTRDRRVLMSSQASTIEDRKVKFPEVPVGFAHRRCASDAMFIKDGISNDEPTSPKSLTASIEQGSRLRMAIANNRPATHLPANHS